MKVAAAAGFPEFPVVNADQSAASQAATATVNAETIAAAIHKVRLGARSGGPWSEGPSPDDAFGSLVGLNLGFGLWRVFAIDELASRAHRGTKPNDPRGAERYRSNGKMPLPA